MKTILIAAVCLLSCNAFAADYIKLAPSYVIMGPDDSDYAIEIAHNYELAANAGNLEALINCGRCYACGFGVEKDPITAINCFMIAANEGSVEAQLICGDKLSFAPFKDLESAALFYKMAADQGNTRGMNCYGMRLRDGDGVEQDLEAAAKYFRLAANLGDISAMITYASCLEYGCGVEQNLEEAAFFTALAKAQQECRNIKEQHTGYRLN
jgi:TPR repeat protein